MPRVTRIANQKTKQYAYENKQSMNLSEVRMWLILKGSPYNFRRQQTLGPYIADFASIAHHIIIEVDGISHDQMKDYEKQREKWISEQGYKILRFVGMIPFPDDLIYEYVWDKIRKLEQGEESILRVMVDE